MLRPLPYQRRRSVGGKTGKTAVLPGFCKIEHGGGSGGAPQNYGGLTWPVRARRAGGAVVMQSVVFSN